MNLIKNLELNPFLRLIWVSKKAKDMWEIPMQQCVQLIQELEIDSVEAGHRLCAWRSIQLRSIPEFTKYCNDKGLNVLPVKLVGNWGQGFAHKTPALKPNEPNPLVYCIISKNMHDAIGYRNAFEDGDNVAQGEYLGFPECCINFFDENWKKGYFDPIFYIAANHLAINSLIKKEMLRKIKKLKKDVYEYMWITENENDFNNILIPESHPFSNPILRYIGIRIGFHIPCSFNCKETLHIAEKRLKLADKDRTKILIALLSMSMSWEVYHGIAIVRTPIFYIVTNSLPTSQKYLVKLKGNFTPRESVKGTTFPFLGL